MILLTATRRDADGAYTFKIQVEGTVRLLTTDPKHAATRLAEMGVAGAERFVRHAQQWGAVEIATE